MLLIGSRAARYWFPDFRRPKDYDIVLAEQELNEIVAEFRDDIRSLKPSRRDKTKFSCHFKTGEFYEFELALPGRSAALLYDSEYVRRLSYRLLGREVGVLTPQALAAVKRSHLHRPIHWEKNMADYSFFKRKGVLITSRLAEIMKVRRQEVEDRGVKVNLNMTNKDFFAKSEKAVGRVFEHDDLHLATCFYERPLYERCKVDLNKAKLDLDLFHNLSYEDRIRLVQEECFAIALERVLIPKFWEKMTKKRFAIELNGPAIEDVKNAFGYALKRICTTLTRGWFREFSIDNYSEIRDFRVDFFDRFLEAVRDGRIQPLNRKDIRSESTTGPGLRDGYREAA